MRDTATMMRRLVAGLLMLATLVAFAGPGWAKAIAPAAARPVVATLDVTAVAQATPETVAPVLTAAPDKARPCDGRGTLSPAARCPTAVPCLTGGLPPGTPAVPIPTTGPNTHARTADDPSCGISTLPDLPPPRRSA